MIYAKIGARRGPLRCFPSHSAGAVLHSRWNLSPHVQPAAVHSRNSYSKTPTCLLVLTWTKTVIAGLSYLPLALFARGVTSGLGLPAFNVRASTVVCLPPYGGRSAISCHVELGPMGTAPTLIAPRTFRSLMVATFNTAGTLAGESRAALDRRNPEIDVGRNQGLWASPESNHRPL